MFPAGLRDKLHQVQEELASSLRTLVLSEPSSPLVIPSKNGKFFEGIRLDAGADLLNHYQFNWCRIREASEQNFRLAEGADKSIQSIAAYINQQHFFVETLTKNLSSISQITTVLSNIAGSLEKTEILISETEFQLALLEDLIKDKELDKRVKEYELNASSICNQKLADLENLKSRLALEHVQKVKEWEEKQLQKAIERQDIFDQAFKTEVQFYRESGSILKLDIPRSEPASLDEFVVEDDCSSLENFLDS